MKKAVGESELFCHVSNLKQNHEISYNNCSKTIENKYVVAITKLS